MLVSINLHMTRCNKRTPVQRTLRSATAHTHPVRSVRVVGTPNAHSLISISSDGKLCSWSLEMLSQPNQYIELMYRQTWTVGATSMCFLHQDVDHFLIGSADGRVYIGSRQEKYVCLPNFWLSLCLVVRIILSLYPKM